CPPCPPWWRAWSWWRDWSIGPLFRDGTIFCPPWRAARLAPLVTRKVIRHALRDIRTPLSFGASDCVALRLRGLVEPAELRQRHRHHFIHIVPARLLRDEILQQTHRLVSVADAIVWSGRQQTDQRVPEREVLRINVDALAQPVPRLVVAPQIDERHRVPERRVGKPRIERRRLQVVRQRGGAPSAAAQHVGE